MANRTLTAMYDTQGAADYAREQLMTLGLSSDAVRVTGGDATTTAATTQTGEGRGFWAGLADLFVPDEDRSTYDEGIRRGGYLLTAQVPEEQVDRAIDVIETTEPVDLDEREASWRASGWTGGSAAYGTAGAAASTPLYEGGAVYNDEVVARDAVSTTEDDARLTRMAPTSDEAGMTSARTETSGLAEAPASFGAGRTMAREASGDDEGSIKVVEEELKIGKRAVDRGGVRVRSYIVETPVEEQVSLRDERVTLERRPVDRAAAPGELDAFQDRVIELTEHGEEAVVSKDARVKEEILLGKEAEERTETVRDKVRSTKVEVEDTRTTGEATTSGVMSERTVTTDDPSRRE